MSHAIGVKRKPLLLVVVSILILITALLTFFVGNNLFGSNENKEETDDVKSTMESKDDSTEVKEANTETDGEEPPTVEEVQKIQETVGVANKDVGAFVSTMHDFYNETTGYGQIEHLNWDEQNQKANEIVDELEPMIASTSDQQLKSDLQSITDLAQKVVNDEQDSGHVRHLHRFFHDLDIALNNYDGTSKIWGVTKSLR
ncbi:hypothetical protein NC661_20710 [Aquibacillus koreensis]|uniref:Uncharacterized protein n=1 Tax=Aquibacillus koreensis TaxID=279446 RepID=A0A9X3WN15_9BACI|nr:hypothetical protein [Aquibacillus koreensis]MCT2535264.1 hypothetical protein [Aquibacillus koreensis]MDC3422777.1 hypothetical protein [Aquibacillus koreensis]